jgi:RNA 3'-terminal phosphate cyclase (ATP)
MRRIEKELRVDAEIVILADVPADGPGSFLFLEAHSEKGVAGFSALGKRGKPAEEVGKEAVDSLEHYLRQKGCLDPYMADQIVLFMALAEGHSCFTTTRVTEHLLTNLWVIERFLGIKILRRGEKGEEGEVEFFYERSVSDHS